MKALEKIRETSNALSACGIDGADKEAEIIVTMGIGSDLVSLYRNDPEISDSQMLIIDEMVGRRYKREPLQYILGHVDFLGLKLLVGRGVLIPRPETELLAEYSIKAVGNQLKARGTEEGKDKDIASSSVEKPGKGRFAILDLCTGSGCLALSLAKEFPEAQVCGTDISDEALNYARKNAAINKIENVEFLAGHLFAPIGKDRMFDVIISNPPYIKTDDIKTLQPEIYEWEPIHALDGGLDGLEFYRIIIPRARKILNDNGILILELGAGCANDVASMLKSNGYEAVEIHEDYADIKRIIKARWTR